MNTQLIDWIWHVRGSVALAPGQTVEQAFGALDPLFHEPGTSHDRDGDALVFRKKGQAAQDKMSVFDAGVLRIENGMAGAVLHYHLISRALLLCFLAPLLFLGFAQLTLFVGNLEKASAEAAGKDAKAAKKNDKKDLALPLNPIDKFLGAPAPEKPKKDGKDKDSGKKKPSATAAYVFAGIFAALYLIGRVLEDKLVKRLFRRRLLGS
ncbi:hypothetical protein [Novosphingobium sp.]|uniref:hypothetical protein n=1 Tax=Novosphingobium sp. TaxID=1874826 RepID=UPI0025DB93BC|nr:hypothetical protein [Novosphingobium sp.]